MEIGEREEREEGVHVHGQSTWQSRTEREGAGCGDMRVACGCREMKRWRYPSHTALSHKRTCHTPARRVMRVTWRVT